MGIWRSYSMPRGVVTRGCFQITLGFLVNNPSESTVVNTSRTPGRMRSIVMSLSVSLFLCTPAHILENHTGELHQIFVHVA